MRPLLAVLVCLGAPAYAADPQARFGPPEAARRLLGPGGPDAATVRANVERDGFHAGEPIGEGACARCHPQVVDQWAASAHRFASFDNPYYRAAFDVFRAERGAEASRFCADCHDPALVAAGVIEVDAPIDVGTPAAQAGIGCRLCHSVHAEPDARGNAGYHADIRGLGLPDRHAAAVASPTLRTARLCGTCHMVGLTEQVLGDTWMRGQDEFTAWYDSTANGHGVSAVWRPAAPPRTCQGCHMPREAALPDEKGAKDGTIASHRFLGANSALPHLRGDADHLARTRAFLEGVVTAALHTPTPGVVDVVLRNRKAAHRFPGGTQDSNEVWLHVQACDDEARVLGESGAVAADGRRDAEAALIRAQPIDGEGKPIQRRAAQHTRAGGFDNGLLPNEARAFRYALPEGTTVVRARLLYRQFDKDYVDFACETVPPGPTRDRCLDPPTIVVADVEVPVRDGRVPPTDDWADLVDYGVALARGLAEHAEAAKAPLDRARALAPDRPEPALAWGRVLARTGQTDALFAHLAAGPAKDHPAADWLRLNAALSAYRHAPAREAAERLAERFPDDRRTLGLLARTRNLTDDPAGALEAADRLLITFPEDEEGLRQRLLALRTLGRDTAAAEATWLRHRRDVARDQRLRQLDPRIAAESVPLRLRSLSPPG